MHQLDEATGTLEWLSDTESPRRGDGPRHVVPSLNGKYLYSVSDFAYLVFVNIVVTNIYTDTLIGYRAQCVLFFSV